MTKNLSKIQDAISFAHRNADMINRNKNFTKIERKSGYKSKKTDRNVTQCTKCKMEKGICHNGCAYGNDEDKRHCVAMN